MSRARHHRGVLIRPERHREHRSPNREQIATELLPDPRFGLANRRVLMRPSSHYAEQLTLQTGRIRPCSRSVKLVEVAGSSPVAPVGQNPRCAGVSASRERCSGRVVWTQSGCGRLRTAGMCLAPWSAFSSARRAGAADPDAPDRGRAQERPHARQVGLDRRPERRQGGAPRGTRQLPGSAPRRARTRSATARRPPRAARWSPRQAQQRRSPPWAARTAASQPSRTDCEGITSATRSADRGRHRVHPRTPEGRDDTEPGRLQPFLASNQM